MDEANSTSQLDVTDLPALNVIYRKVLEEAVLYPGQLGPTLSVLIDCTGIDELMPHELIHNAQQTFGMLGGRILKEALVSWIEQLLEKLDIKLPVGKFIRISEHNNSIGTLSVQDSSQSGRYISLYVNSFNGSATYRATLTNSISVQGRHPLADYTIAQSCSQQRQPLSRIQQPDWSSSTETVGKLQLDRPPVNPVQLQQEDTSVTDATAGNSTQQTPQSSVSATQLSKAKPRRRRSSAARIAINEAARRYKGYPQRRVPENLPNSWKELGLADRNLLRWKLGTGERGQFKKAHYLWIDQTQSTIRRDALYHRRQKLTKSGIQVPAGEEALEGVDEEYQVEDEQMADEDNRDEEDEDKAENENV